MGDLEMEVQWMHKGCIDRATTSTGRTFANWNVLAGIVIVVVVGGHCCYSNVGLGVFELADLRPVCGLHYGWGWGSDKHNTEFEQFGHGLDC